MNNATLDFVTGDATQPIGPGQKAIVHICNDVGAWGAGFVLALSNRWCQPEMSYSKLDGRALSTLDIVRVEEDIAVVNLIGQHRTSPLSDGRSPIRYWAVSKGLNALGKRLNIKNKTANEHERWSVHMPRIGCGLAGGHWDEIEEIVFQTLVYEGINVTVYDLPE